MNHYTCYEKQHSCGCVYAWTCIAVCVCCVCYHGYLSTIYFPTKAAGSLRLPSISLPSHSVCVSVSDLLMNQPPIAARHHPSATHTHLYAYMCGGARAIKHTVCMNMMTHTHTHTHTAVWRWCVFNGIQFFLICCLLHRWKKWRM